MFLSKVCFLKGAREILVGSLRHTVVVQTSVLVGNCYYGWFPATLISSSCSFRTVCKDPIFSVCVLKAWVQLAPFGLQNGNYYITGLLAAVCFHWNSAQQQLLFEPTCSVTSVLWLWYSQKSFVWLSVKIVSGNLLLYEKSNDIDFITTITPIPLFCKHAEQHLCKDSIFNLRMAQLG